MVNSTAKIVFLLSYLHTQYLYLDNSEILYRYGFEIENVISKHHYWVVSALIILCTGGVVNVYIHNISQNNIIYYWVKIRSFRALLLLNISSGNASVLCNWTNV